jgi:hypothetical protein
MSASTSDPRRPDAIVEYRPEVKRIEDDDPDVPGFVALVFGSFINFYFSHTQFMA